VSEITIVQQVSSIEVAAAGPQGPTGLPGGTYYEHVQSPASATWVIDHNLGRKVHVSVFDTSGRLVLTDVEHGTADQATVTWATPTAGSAVIS
jgi:hypothetical protein